MPKGEKMPHVGERLYQARLRNAHRVAHRMIAMQQEGYLLFDIDNEVYSPVVIDAKTGSVYFEHCDQQGVLRYIIFEADPSLDNGAFTSVKDFNQEMSAIRAIHPRDIKFLRL
jgi:hypothetical protein